MAKYEIMYDSSKNCFYHEEHLMNSITGEAHVIRNDFQSRLEAYRKLRGLTREQLSRLSGVKVTMLTKYETRERDLARAAYITVRNIANALGVDPDQLIDTER